MPKISVIVPVYNTEKFLGKCLDSVINQTFSDIEIICMDDGSTDASGSMLDKYAYKDGRIRVVHKNNSGYGNTMNQALAIASGEYIGVVESDDYIASDMYEKMYTMAEQHGLDFIKSDFYRMWDHEDGTEEIEYKRLTDQGGLYGRVLKPNEELETYYMEKFTWNALYRRKFLIENNISYNETPGASYQDNGFWFQTFYFAQRVMFLNEAFYRYKQDNPDSSVNSNKKIYAMKNEYDFIRKFLFKQKNVDSRLFKICFHFRMDGYLFTLLMLADQYKLELAKVIKRECEDYELIGEADFSRLSEAKISMIQQIRSNPYMYVEEQIAQNRKIEKLLDGYFHIVIYGAGCYGRKTYIKLKRMLSSDVKIDVAVTSLKGKKCYCYSSIIKEILDFADEKDTCVVVLAVKEESLAEREMFGLLKTIGFSNVVKHGRLLG